MAADLANHDDATERVCSVADLPGPVLEKVFASLSAQSLAKCLCVCHSWKDAAARDELWEPLCGAEWSLWEEDPAPQENWRAIYAHRVQVSREVEKLVDELAWPLRRPATYEQLATFGVEAQEAVMGLANCRGLDDIGRSYWGSMALTRVSGSRCAARMAKLCAYNAQQAELELEQGALLLAEAHDSRADMKLVKRLIVKLAQELQRRMEAARVSGGVKALELLSELLFGQPPAGVERGVSWDEVDDISGEQYVPPDGCGLGLLGNRENYYDPRNSLLTHVLRRGVGIPISLAVLHAAVGRRAGLDIHCVGMPMHFVNSLGTPGSEDEVFVDVYDGGLLLNREEMADLMAAIGLPFDESLLQPIAAPAVYMRMCTNLVNIYRQQRDYLRLRTVLDILLSAGREPTEFLLLHAQVCMHLSDHDAAKQDLEKLLEAHGSDGHYRQWVHQAQQEKEKYRRECERVLMREAYPQVQFRVGDIIRHRAYDYRGVVIGWDACCSAEEDWMVRMNVDGLPGGRDQPFYNVLVDVRDRPFQSTYVAQDNMLLLRDMATHNVGSCEVQHPEIGEHFDSLDTAQRRYNANAYLRHKYPQDIFCAPAIPEWR